MPTIITRKEAHERGLKRFYTGRPCSKNHDAERFVTTGGCVKCNAERSGMFKKSTSAASVSRLRGHFGYPLHPDDYAAALAYCQALDLQRGRTPYVPEAPPPVDEVTAADIAAIRAQAFGRIAEQPAGVDASEAWLRDVVDNRVK